MCLATCRSHCTQTDVGFSHYRIPFDTVRSVRRLTESAFDSIRLVLVVVAVLLRLCLMPVYLQAYLNIAYDRLEEQKKEAGRITNVELQKNVASIFYYLCVVTLQYVAPILLCMYVALMYKTLGGYRWTDLYRSAAADVECGLEQTATAVDLLREQMASSRRPLIDALTGEELPVDDGLLVTARMSLDGLKAVSVWIGCRIA